MKKIILLIMLLLTGCSNETIYVDDEKIITFCDEKYGIEYILFRGYHGITIRLDEKGDVIHCEVSK